MSDLKPGFYPSLPSEVYHAPRLGVVSKSALDQLRRSPAHYLAWATGQREKTTPALVFGTAGHCAVFEPEKYARRYVVEPDFGDCRFKENKTKRDAWRAEHSGFELLTSEDAAKHKAIQTSIHRHELVRRLLSEGQRESTLVWVDPETELTCKIRADFYAERFETVVDLKLVEDASPGAFAKSVGRYYYHVQDALYRAGFSASGKPARYFLFVAIEKEAPFASAVYQLDADAVAAGHDRARSGMEQMAECIKTNSFPGYPLGIQIVSLPPWAA